MVKLDFKYIPIIKHVEICMMEGQYIFLIQ